MLRIEYFVNHSIENWNRLLIHFDSTINYTPWFLNYIEVLNASSEIQNHTFVLYNDNNPIAIVPLYIERINNKLQISMGQEPVYAPIFNKNLPISSIEKYFENLIDQINEVAKENQCVLARFQFSPLLNYNFSSVEYLKSNYCEDIFYPDWYIFKSKLSFVLNLENNNEQLFKAIRKGHKSNIRQTSKISNLVLIDKDSFNEELFGRYISLYYKVKGNKRSLEAFKLDSNAIKSGLQFILICEYDNEFIGAIAFHIHNNKARYNSSVQLYNINLRIHPTHFLLWSGIEYLKDKNYEFLEIGEQVIENEKYIVSSKEKNLSHFKSGWGCDLISSIKIQKEFKNV